MTKPIIRDKGKPNNARGKTIGNYSSEKLVRPPLTKGEQYKEKRQSADDVTASVALKSMPLGRGVGWGG